MSHRSDTENPPDPPLWLRGLGALLIGLMMGGIGWAVWIASQNFFRIGV